MAFDAAGLNTISASKSGNAPALFSYATSDTIATLNTANYFTTVADLFEVGDIIFARTSTAGTQAVSICFVASVSGTSIDVTDGLTVTATDSD